MDDPLVLEPIAQRILGALMEKEVTVPASYPLSLNGLRTACNQTSSRDPITDYDDATLLAAIKALREDELVRSVWAGKGSRALKYHQLLSERLGLTDEERAVITVLLLRGQQSAGELRTRTERLHAFADRDAVESVLHRLAEREVPLVRELPRRPGQQDHRWVHLLGIVAEPEPTAVAAADQVDRERVLAQGAASRDAKVRDYWSLAAPVYAAEADAARDPEGRPIDCWLLGRVAAIAGDDPVLDVGCGPGRITAYLAGLGADATGLDLSPGMIEQARQRHPELTFVVGNQNDLTRPPRAHAWGAITSFFSTIHLAFSELPGLFGEFARVLRPGGAVLLAVRPGHDVQHRDVDRHGNPADLDVVFHDPAAVVEAVRRAGLVDVEWYRCHPEPGDPDPERLFVLARAPQPDRA